MSQIYLISIMLENSWSNKLTQQPKYSTIVNLPHPAIVYQSQSNQLMVHSQSQSSPLPIRKDILSIGSLPTGQILLLTRYQLSCFDLLNNNELFSLEFQNAIKLYVEENMILVVCGCDLFCYNLQGEELYVNHCSALIECLTTIDIKGNKEIVLGLNDLNMLRYKGVNISLDYGKIVGIPVSICSLQAFILLGTQEGTIALYEGKKSKWRAKSNHPVFKVMAFRTESDYLAIIGRKDGFIEIKDWKNKGETVHKVKLNQQLIGLHIHDFRQEDNQQLICILKSGNVKGLNIYEQTRKNQKKLVADQVKLQQQGYDALQNQKLTLQFQINQLKERITAHSNSQQMQQDQNILSADFNFTNFLIHEKDGLVLRIKCFNGYISGLIFEQPIMPVQFDRAVEIVYNFKAENMIFGQVNCSALVHSNFNSKIYQAKHFKILLPKFWKFDYSAETVYKISSGIRINFVQRNARFIKWISQCFFMKWQEDQKVKLQNVNPLKLRYSNAYDKIGLEFVFASKQGKVEIWCDCLKTLGDIFQDLIEYVGLKELNSQLWFPNEKQKLKDTLKVIEKLSQAKVSISSEMAEAIDNIKFLLVKGQSSRCVGSMNDLRKTYTDIMGYNRNLLTQIQKKSQNTKQLSQSLKILGQFINQTANVRYGTAKQQMVVACRQAIKRKQFPKILTIMQRGISST